LLRRGWELLERLKHGKRLFRTDVPPSNQADARATLGYAGLGHDKVPIDKEYVERGGCEFNPKETEKVGFF
jgi:hypothetical protein